MTKITYLEAQGYAKIMRTHAQQHLARGLNTWKGESDMIAMVRADAKDYRAIAQLLRANKIRKARDLAGSLDTAARDTIPDTIWDAMIEHCDYTEKEYEVVTKFELDSLIQKRDLLNMKIEHKTEAYKASQKRK